MLLLHHDTFLFIPITSDSNNLSELIRHLQQMCFERGTRQSLEPTPRPASHHGLLIFKDTPAGIPPRSTRRKTAQASCSRKAAHDGTPLESLVACLQSRMHVVIYPCRSTRLTGHPRQRERGTPPAPATPTQRKTAVPVHDLHDWNSRPLVPVLPSPAFFGV